MTTQFRVKPCHRCRNQGKLETKIFRKYLRQKSGPEIYSDSSYRSARSAVSGSGQCLLHELRVF